MKLLLGNTITQQGEKLVTIDAESHAFIVGKSGSGKSTLLSNLIVQDIRRGNGVLVLDPHGELVETILRFIPNSRKRDVVVFDPHSQKVIPLRVLRHKDQLLANNFIEILRSICGDNSFMGRSFMIARNLLYALIEVEQDPTPWHFYSLFISKGYRDKIFALAEKLTSKNFSVWWENDVQERTRQDAEVAPMNKADALIACDKLRHIYSSTEGALDFYEAIQKRKIILCPLKKGLLGKEETEILASNIISEIYFAAMRRVFLRRGVVPPVFRVYADEAHAISKGQSFEQILAETRKYSVFLTLATQTLAQLPDSVVPAILGNVGNLIVGAVSADDGKKLAPEIGLEDGQTLTHQPFGQFYAKITSFGSIKKALVIQPVSWKKQGEKTYNFGPRPLGYEARPQDILKYSYDHYGRPREEIEATLPAL